MTAAASGLVLSLFLATAYGAIFHLIMGGPPRKIALYVISSWIGFIIGHFFGVWLGFDIFRLGTIYLLSASIGAWLAIITGWFLNKQQRA